MNTWRLRIADLPKSAGAPLPAGVAAWDLLKPLELVARHLTIAAALVLAVLVILVSVSEPVRAAELPHPDSTGFPPSCDRGYQDELGTCVAVKVPQHAFLDSFGDGWECARGYHLDGEHCAAVRLPRHAHLTDYSLGNGWECDPGYQDDGYNCL